MEREERKDPGASWRRAPQEGTSKDRASTVRSALVHKPSRVAIADRYAMEVTYGWNERLRERLKAATRSGV